MNIPFFNKKPKPKILVFTGAGLSAPSGLQTFRTDNGYWHEFDPKVVANMRTFYKNRETVFEFYNRRRQQLEYVKPNNGHKMIASLQSRYGKERVKICTQNVDNLLEQAGCQEVLHVHGRLTDMMCIENQHVWDVGYMEVNSEHQCPVCLTFDIKPGVVFFHEPAPEYGTMDNLFDSNLRNENDIVLCIGTSFKVISEDRIIGYSTSYNILANLHQDPQIDYSHFDEVIIGDIEETYTQISELIIKRLK